MAYLLDIDPARSRPSAGALAQVQALPPAGTDAIAEAFAVLEFVPERGDPLNADNPDGGLYQFM